MTALARTSVVPSEAMHGLHEAGLSLLPLGAGDDGKGPLVKFEGKPRLQFRQVLGPMHRIGSACFGIRLDGLAVIDCDEDDPGLIADMEARFGASPVQVRTPRGRHLYYRFEGGRVPNLRSEGLPVDIKRGANSYVMAPGSVRPDGGEYVGLLGVLGETPLPQIRLPSAQRHQPRIETGGRNRALTIAAIGMVESVNDTDELLGNLQYLRDEECEQPETISDAELRGIADWAWAKRLGGNVMRGRNSEFRIHRMAIDTLKQAANTSDAIALFTILQMMHGHRSAVAFPLSYEAMKEGGHTDLTRRRFLAARKSLEEANLLQTASKHQPGKAPRTYRLNRLHPSAANVLPLYQGEGV